MKYLLNETEIPDRVRALLQEIGYREDRLLAQLGGLDIEEKDGTIVVGGDYVITNDDEFRTFINSLNKGARYPKLIEKQKQTDLLAEIESELKQQGYSKIRIENTMSEIFEKDYNSYQLNKIYEQIKSGIISYDVPQTILESEVDAKEIRRDVRQFIAENFNLFKFLTKKTNYKGLFN